MKKEEIGAKEALKATNELYESIEWLSSMTKDEPYNGNVKEMQKKLDVIKQYIEETDKQLDFYCGR